MNSTTNYGLFDINKLVQIAHNIERLVVTNNYLINSRDSNIINVKTFENRKILINDLTNIIQIIPIISGRLEALLEKTISNHAREISAVEQIKTGGEPPHELYSVVTKKERRPSVSNKDASIIKDIISPTIASTSNIPITPNISISARIVQNFNQVGCDLCYVQPNDHFAIMIAGKLFHGNIAIIYVDEKIPSNIRPCRFAGNCSKISTCDYYHDPLKYAVSKDCQNFIANSFVYCTGKTKIRGRKFGSRDRLETDLLSMTTEDIERYMAQTMHDILCSIILYNAKLQ